MLSSERCVTIFKTCDTCVALRLSEIYSLCLMTWQHVVVISFSHLAHYDSSLLAFLQSLNLVVTVAPSLAQQIPDLFTVHPSEQKDPDQNGSEGLATARFPCLGLQPSGLSDALHPPHNSWEEQRPGWQQNVAQGDPAMSQSQQNTKNQQWRTFSRRMDDCVGVWVVLWWVSSPHIKNVSSPRVWPSVQACMSLCGFPAVSSHSSKNVHTEKLPSGCECLSCDELDLMLQCI